MRHELFIDDKKVDISSNTNINLTYKSNLLSELDKIVSSYSYTIRLPKTSRNMELIEGCNIPSNNSSFAYLPHRARLLRDGIEIVRDAVVVLLSVGSDIQISITWGNVSALVMFVKEKRSIRDLDLGEVTWTIDDTEETPYADYGENIAFNQPVAKVSNIFNAINNESVKLSIPDTTKIQDMVIPLLKLAGSEEYIEEYMVSGYKSYNSFSFLTVFNGNGLSDSRSLILSSAYDEGYSYITRRTPNVKFTVKGWIDFIYRARDTNIEVTMSDGVESNIQYSETFVDENRGKHFRFNIDKTYDKDGGVYFEISTSLGAQNIQAAVECSLTITSEATAGIIYPEYEKPVTLKVAPNLPDITQIDFLKAIMLMMGWYAEPMEGDSGIKMLPYSTITDNKSKAIDWSVKLVNKRIEPTDIEFCISDMARKNYFRYAEDDTVTGDYDCYIEIDDDTLEISKDVVTLPFAATDKSTRILGGTTESIPLYTVAEDGKIEINTSITPRIFKITGTSLIKLNFDDLHWSKLINENWQAYQNIIRRPKIITEQVRLNAIDLKQIDMTIPVYISQYGSYFAILEIKTKNDDICDVQLLKI